MARLKELRRPQTLRGAMAAAAARVPCGNPFIHLDDRNRMTKAFAELF